MIPEQFHRIWFGPKVMPDAYLGYGESWVTHNPGWTLTDWDYETLPPLRNQAAFDGCGVDWQTNPGGGKSWNATEVQRADIASYDLLYQFGGVYLNCDMEARRPLNDLLDGVSCFLVLEQGEYPSNAVMGATARHPFVAHVLDTLPERIRALPGHPMNEQTGPHLLAAALRTWDGEPPRIFGPEVFMPFLYNDMRPAADFPDAVAVHHWGHATPDEALW